MKQKSQIIFGQTKFFIIEYLLKTSLALSIWEQKAVIQALYSQKFRLVSETAFLSRKWSWPFPRYQFSDTYLLTTSEMRFCMTDLSLNVTSQRKVIATIVSFHAHSFFCLLFSVSEKSMSLSNGRSKSIIPSWAEAKKLLGLFFFVENRGQAIWQTNIVKEFFHVDSAFPKISIEKHKMALA